VPKPEILRVQYHHPRAKNLLKFWNLTTWWGGAVVNVYGRAVVNA
jgi:hypothetical protein